MRNVNFNAASFSFVNDKTQSLVIYSTTDTSWNPLTFTILNNTGIDLTLKGGDPVNGVQAGAASSFAFDFRTILTDDQAKAIVIKDQLGQWAALYFPPGQTNNPTWAVAPVDDLVFKNGDQIVFALSNITCEFQQPTSYADLFYFNVPGVNPRQFPFSYLVSVLNPPVGKDLKSVVDCGVLNGSVVHVIGSQAPAPPGGNGPPPIEVDITYDNNFPIKNGLTVYLKNNSSSPLVPPGTSLGGAFFTVAFLFGTQNDDAITTQALGDTITIAIDAESSQWTANAHQQGTPNWTFTPLSQPLMSAYETVNLVIGNIITDLNVNPQTLSSMHVQWNFVPGYADGYYSIELQKQTANPGIPSFNIVPSVVNLGQDVQITYQTMVAAYITLGYVRRDGSSVLLTSPQDIGYNEEKFPSIPDKEATVFTLSVYRGPGQAPDTSATFPITVNQPPATINYFTATSYLVNIYASNTVTLNWQVENAKTIVIVGYGVQTGGSLSVTVNSTTTFILQVTPWGSNGQLVQASLTVYAYKSYTPLVVGPMGDGSGIPSRPIGLGNRSRGIVYASNATDGKIYQVSVDEKKVSPTQFPGFMAMTLSADESKLFVVGGVLGPFVYMCDTSDMSVFTGPNILFLNPPYTMAVNSTCTELFYPTYDPLGGRVYTLTVNEAANQLEFLNKLTVGDNPRALAFDGAGVNLYVGNYDSSSVSVINLAQNAVTATIQLQSSEPCAFALAGNLLFVACSGGNQVCVIDTSNNSTKAPITAGVQPSSLTLDQNEARLFVTNFQGGSVTVIDTATSAVTATLQVGNGPSAAEITESGNLMFVSNYWDKSLTVVDISNGGAVVVGTIPLDASNGNPVDVSSFTATNFYTDVFVAKEYFLGRNNGCPGSKATDANLNMSILSVQEKASGQAHARAVPPDNRPKGSQLCQ